MKKRKITMQDIANHLQISKNTVSRALSDRPGVSEETKDLVLEKADKLGYTYKPRQTNNNQVENIALIASNFAFSQTFFGNIYLSVEKEVKRRGINLLIESISPKTANNLSLPLFINNKSVQGVIILSHITTDYINKVISTGIPTVLIDHHHPHIQADAILTNNSFGAYRAVEHLIKKDHHKIGFVGNTSFSPSYYERLQGYKMALEDYKIPIEEKYILKNTPDDEDIVEEYINSLNELPTAWLCINDKLGYVVNSLLKKRGYRIPEDSSIISFDNGQLSQISSPRLTSMDINMAKYGEKGVEQLLWRINHPKEPTQEVLYQPKMIEGKSVAWNKQNNIGMTKS